MKYNPTNGQIYDPEDGQTIATMSESATPEQAKLLTAARAMLAALQQLIEAATHHQADAPAALKAARAAIAQATQEPAK